MQAPTHVEGSADDVGIFLKLVGNINRRAARAEQQRLATQRRRAKNKVARKSRKANR
jgi:hypothetical protein